WFNESDVQWVVEMGSSAWATLPESALATGWVFYDWAFAFCQSNGAWHWINEPDWQWVLNMRTGEWTRFGAAGGKALLTWADVAGGFAGTFGVPLAEEGDYRFGYSSGVHEQLENGNLLVDGHPYYDRQAQVQVPGVLDGREGVRTGGWIDLTGGLKPPGWTEGDERIVLGGLLQVTGRIHFTKHQWYNGSGTNWPTQGRYDGALDGSGTASGLWGVDNGYAHHSRAGGYMSEPPEALREAGYAYLAGLEGTSGAALGRWGPNLFAVRAEVSGGEVPAATLICHPSEALQAPAVRASNATSAWWVANRPANETWWIANQVTDMKWIETGTRHGVLCFVYRGIGQQWYGASDGGPGLPDPYGGGSGYHAEGWALQAWIYDPADLMEVFRGEREAWSLAPEEVVLLTERLPGAGAESHHSVFSGSARAGLKASVRGNRLIVLQENEHPASEWENTPKGYVFTLP
ncbi:MAG: hypothetical protein GX548_09385, partial [Lentisphaerae bacterium]|nr:hypothetical protein [Lentisphaerota bacterium]